MREIQDMTLNLSRGLERLERRLAERKERFEQEFRCLETPENAWGIRMTAVPVGEEFRIDRVFCQGRIAEKFEEPWHEVRIRENGNERPLDTDFHLLLQGLWKPRLRATRRESGSDFSSDLPRNLFREFHSDGLVEMGLVSIRSFGPGNDTSLPPAYPVEMFANLAVWADRVRNQAGAPAAEYALEVEIRIIGGTVEVYNPGHPFRDDRPILPSGSIVFPRYPVGDSGSIPDLLTLFDRDFWNSLGEDRAAAETTFTIPDWPG